MSSRHANVRNYLQYILYNAKEKSKRCDMDCSIDLDYLMGLLEKQDWICYWSGDRMTFSEAGALTNISIDRVYPDKGYVPENVVLCCSKVIEIKNSNSPEEMLFWCQAVVDWHGGNSK